MLPKCKMVCPILSSTVKTIVDYYKGEKIWSQSHHAQVTDTFFFMHLGSTYFLYDIVLYCTLYSLHNVHLWGNLAQHLGLWYRHTASTLYHGSPWLYLSVLHSTIAQLGATSLWIHSKLVSVCVCICLKLVYGFIVSLVIIYKVYTCMMKVYTSLRCTSANTSTFKK